MIYGIKIKKGGGEEKIPCLPLETLVKLDYEQEVLNMAGRFMKIKRIVIPFMTLVVMTSQLAGCATMSSQEMLKSMNESPEVVIEYAVPDTGQQSLDASQVIGTGDAQSATDVMGQDDSTIGIIGVKDEEKQPLSGDELISYFQLAYDSCSAFESASQEEQINFELDILVSFSDTDGEKLPADYADQYRAWRPADQQAPEATLTFTEVNETVYATGTVNLRSGPSTDDAKVGQLNKVQSVTRTGIGTGDYSSWSRIKLSDGTEVYVASSYLTTTKPTAQSNTQQNSGSNNMQGQPQGGGSQQTNTSQQPQSGIIYGDDEFNVIDPWAGMTPEEKAAQQQKDAESLQTALDETQGTMH